MPSANGVLTAKLDRVFAMLDASGDGRLEASDISILASRLANAFGSPEADAKIKHLEQTLLNIWETDLLKMDSDGDGTVDREEFDIGMRKAFAEDQDGMLRRFSTMVDAWMDICDVSGDGRIDLGEFTQMYNKTLGVPEEDLKIAFGKLDSDGSGFLSREEIRTATREYYTSDDAETPGNWLFGPPSQPVRN